jgi:ornithine carbamoyltransferase
MRRHFKGKGVLKPADFTPEEVGCFVDIAIERRRVTGEVFEPLRGKVIESKYCVLWSQGENRRHTEKAVLELTKL